MHAWFTASCLASSSTPIFRNLAASTPHIVSGNFQGCMEHAPLEAQSSDCNYNASNAGSTTQLSGEALWEVARAALKAPMSRWAEASGDSLVIFDWDDTLLPTSVLTAGGHFLAENGAAADEPFTSPLVLWTWRAELAACAAAGLQALRVAKQHGKVIVVTNAMHGWVHATAARFMPQLAAELEGVPVISARSIYEPQGFADPATWKMLCFQRVLQCVQFDPWGALGPRSVVSIGDSWHEREAVMRASTDIGPWCYVKSLKLAERPTMSQITHQLHLFATHFAWLANHQGSLDLSIHDSWMGPICSPVPSPTLLSMLSAQSCGSFQIENSQAWPTQVQPPSAPLALTPAPPTPVTLTPASTTAPALSSGEAKDPNLTSSSGEVSGLDWIVRTESESKLSTHLQTQSSGYAEVLRKLPTSSKPGLHCPGRHGTRGTSRCRDLLRVRRDPGICKRRVHHAEQLWRRRWPQQHATMHLGSIWQAPHCFGS